MNAFADFLIGVLAKFKTFGAANKLMFVGFALGAPFAALWGWMQSRRSRIVSEALALERDLEDAKQVIADRKAELRRQTAFGPDGFRLSVERERRDNNRRRLVAAADGYMAHHRAPFAEACRILTDHHLSRCEEGADALRRARAAAMGAAAAAPDDRDLAFLLDEIDALLRVETARPETPEAAREQEERDRLRRLLRDTPDDVDALCKVADVDGPHLSGW